jgi:hypothetical protein
MQIQSIAIVLVVLATVIALIKLGSLSVWVTVLSMSVKALLAILAALLVGVFLFAMWQLFFSDNSSRGNQ